MNSYVTPSGSNNPSILGSQSVVLIQKDSIQICLLISLTNQNDLADKLFTINDECSKEGYEISYNPTTNCILIEGGKDRNIIAEQINKLTVSGVVKDKLDISNIEQHALSLYYQHMMKATATQVGKTAVYEIKLFTSVLIKELTKQTLPIVNKVVVEHLSIIFISNFIKKATELKFPSKKYYLLQNEVMFLLSDDQMAVVGGRKIILKTAISNLEAMLLPSKVISDIIPKQSQEEQLTEVPYRNLYSIQNIKEDSLKLSNIPDIASDSININDSKISLKLSDASHQSKIVNLSVPPPLPIYSSIRVSTHESSQIKQLIAAFANEKPKTYFDDDDLTIEYRIPNDEEVRLYYCVSKKYLNSDLRKTHRNCCIKLYKKFEWFDKEGKMEELEDNERNLLNLELEKSILMKKMLSITERKVGNSVLKSTIVNKKQKMIHEYKNGVKINSYSRKVKTSVPTLDIKPCLFGTNKLIDSTENYILTQFNFRKNRSRTFYLSKFIPIMSNAEFKKKLYVQYMVKVLGMRPEDNCLILLGVRIGGAFNQISSEYEVYNIEESKEELYPPKNTEPQKPKPVLPKQSVYKEAPTMATPAPCNESKPAQSTASSVSQPKAISHQISIQVPKLSTPSAPVEVKSSINLSTQVTAVEIPIYNKEDWMTAYVRIIDGKECLCFPLKLQESHDITTIGQIVIHASNFKEVINVDSIQSFPSNVEAFIDDKFVLIRSASLVELAIMYDIR